MNKNSILLWDEMNVKEDDRLYRLVQHSDVELFPWTCWKAKLPSTLPGPFALVPGIGLETASDE